MSQRAPTMKWSGRCLRSPGPGRHLARGIDVAQRICSFPGCDKPHKARGLCISHYKAARKAGTLERIKPAQTTYGERAPFITPKGYVRLYRPAHPLANRWGHVMEHRMVAWDCGILTDPSFHVHHINGDPSDNQPENLAAMTYAEHAQHHGRERDLGPEHRRAYDRARYSARYERLTCEVCGREFMWREPKGEGWQYDRRGCSNKCRGALRRAAGWRPAYIHDCEFCGREFRSRMGDARFCGNKCRAAAGLPGGG